ncbi:hypothetical protein H2200_008474 [Cladophialophora chaetospira]|uniref:Xylanolytic transcriptional activator regulatory domain-containing protein n=1 Tax=Cladophialophora chaetospira TaxID=386627 RepID=A0AA38X6B8_9EURO|nr:hypothetical protein H2200_008474 [Cladophialophora chaetospira]
MSKLLATYHEFWGWFEHRQSDTQNGPDPQYVPLWFAIWFAGSMCISSQGLNMWFPGTERNTLSAHFQERMKKSLALLSFPDKASLQCLSALLTGLTLRESSRSALSTGIELGLALRVAQTMGLHRDPELFNLPSWETISRRQIWWHIVQADSALALATGLPILVHDQNFWDTKSAAKLEDMKCATRQLVKIRLGTKPISRTDMDDARSILLTLERDVQAITKIVILSEAVLWQSTPSESHSNQSWSADTSPTMLCEPTTFDLEVQSSPSQSTVGYHILCLSSFHKWLELYLKLIIDKLYCLFYQPFLKRPKSDLWRLARTSALRHSQNLIQSFVLLATDPSFQPFQWKCPGTHWPMQTAMIILVDLYERPHSEEATSSRALIDELFKLSGLVMGAEISENHEEWRMLLRLRTNVWQRIGLDPKLFWTKEQHLQASASPSSVSASSVQRETPDRELQTRWDPQHQVGVDSMRLRTQNRAQSRQTEFETENQPAASKGRLSQPLMSFEENRTLNLMACRSCDPSARTEVDVGETFVPSLQVLRPTTDTTLMETMPDACHQSQSASNTELDDARAPVDVDPQFDWEAWDRVFGEEVPCSFGIDTIAWTDTSTFVSDSFRQC